MFHNLAAELQDGHSTCKLTRNLQFYRAFLDPSMQHTATRPGCRCQPSAAAKRNAITRQRLYVNKITSFRRTQSMPKRLGVKSPSSKPVPHRHQTALSVVVCRRETRQTGNREKRHVKRLTERYTDRVWSHLVRRQVFRVGLLLCVCE